MKAFSKLQYHYDGIIGHLVFSIFLAITMLQFPIILSGWASALIVSVGLSVWLAGINIFFAILIYCVITMIIVPAILLAVASQNDRYYLPF